LMKDLEAPQGIDLLEQVERLIDRVRGVSEVRDAAVLRRFELGTLRHLETLLIQLRAFNEEKEEISRKLKTVVRQVSSLHKEHDETFSKYKEARQQVKQMETATITARNDVLKFHGQFAHKQVECEQLRAQINWMSTDLKEKQKALWSMVSLTDGQPGATGRPAQMSGVGDDQANTLSFSKQEVPRHQFCLAPPLVPLSTDVFLRPGRKVSLEQLKSPDLDTFSLDSADMLCLIEDMFREFQLFERLDIPLSVFRAFLVSVHSKYRSNPFHNFHHAFCVCQMMFVVLSSGVASRVLPLDVLVLLLSAICHDLDHPGLNNGFLIASKSPLAMIYNDQSVLENYHTTTMFSVLAHPETDLFLRHTPENKRELRQRFIKCVVSTDMGKHFAILRETDRLDEVDTSDEGEMQLLLNLLLKCCDVSNEVRPFHVSRRWAQNLLDEFFAQVHSPCCGVVYTMLRCRVVCITMLRCRVVCIHAALSCRVYCSGVEWSARNAMVSGGAW